MNLPTLAHDADVFLYEDAGSGVLVDLTEYGLGDEPVISESISAGADVVSFSGDKLLGASQAGLIVGRREVIDRLRKHSLYRALRADKLCLAALEATLEAHRRSALEEIPTLRMLGLSKESIETRARSIAGIFAEAASRVLTATVIPGESAVGGGSGPNVHPPTALLALKHATYNADELQEKLRLSSPPVICRIADGLVLIDLRTVEPHDEPDVIADTKIARRLAASSCFTLYWSNSAQPCIIHLAFVLPAKVTDCFQPQLSISLPNLGSFNFLQVTIVLRCSRCCRRLNWRCLVVVRTPVFPSGRVRDFDKERRGSANHP